MLEPSKNGIAWIDDLTGGYNTTDPPSKIGDNQLQVAENIEWIETALAQRRQGGQNNIGTEPWGSGKSIVASLRHTPTADEGDAELWGIDNSLTIIAGRLAAGSNFSAVTITDAITFADAVDWTGISFNGKLFLAYNSAVDRLHVWDGTSWRRVGLATPAAPTVADTGAGTYAAVKRWYKVAWVNNTDPLGSILSEPSAAVSFTPSGAGTAARITRPALAGESETHWAVLGSPDNVNYYIIAAPTAATTTFDDNLAPSTYASTTSIPSLTATFVGDYYTVPPSPKFLLVDGARLLLLSSWETAAYRSRVWWTPILHSSVYPTADDERVPSTNYLDLDPTEAGGITGGAMYAGSPYVFKTRRIYKLNATANATKPYTRTIVSRTVGALNQRSLVIAEDDEGNECLYFMGTRGPYRLSPYGLEYLGRDLEAFWKTVDISNRFTPLGLYHEHKRQVWFWLTASNPGAVVSNTLLKLHVRRAKRQGDGTVRGGWSFDTGDIAAVHTAVMFSKTLGATMSKELRPYVAHPWQSGDPDGPFIMYDADGIYTDGGSARLATYTGKFKTKAFAPGGRDKRGGLLEAFITAKATGCALNVSAVRDYGVETVPGAVTISGDPNITRDDRKIENLTLGDCKVIELTLDDGGQGLPWTVDAIGLCVKEEGQR